MKYRSLIGLVVALLFVSGAASAQKVVREKVREGNKLYKKEQFTESEIAYRKGLEANPRSTEGAYNLGNSLYKQEKYKEATEQYQNLLGQGERMLQEDPKNGEKLAQALHNLGNIGMKNKEYAQSIEAYKQSLRLNPSDEETRYNLALAQKLLEDQQNQGQDQDQDQNEDQQDQDQDQEQNQDEQNQNQQQQQNEDQENKTQEEPQQNEQMSQDNAQQILDAFLQDEKDTQEKVKKAQAAQHEKRKTEKEW